MRFPACNTGVGFQGRVVITLVIEPVFTNVVGRGKASLHVAKLIGDSLVNVTDTRFVVDFDLWMG